MTKEMQKRISDLMYLEQCIQNAIHEEIKETLKGRPADIVDRLKYILDESRLQEFDIE